MHFYLLVEVDTAVVEEEVLATARGAVAGRLFDVADVVAEADVVATAFEVTVVTACEVDVPDVVLGPGIIAITKTPGDVVVAVVAAAVAVVSAACPVVVVRKLLLDLR